MDFDLMITSFPKLLGATVITLKLLSASLFFGLFLGLFLFGIQLIGNFYPDETELLTKWNPINWFNPSSIIISSDPTYENLIQNDEIIKLILSLKMKEII